MFQSLRGAVTGGAALLAFTSPASATVLIISFSGTTYLADESPDGNYVRETDATGTRRTDAGPATLSGTVRIDTDRLPADSGSGDDFDFFSDVAPFLVTNVSLTGGAAPDFGGSVYVSNQLRGTFGTGSAGYVDLNDDRMAQDTAEAKDSSSFYLYATSDVSAVTVDGFRLPDFANTGGLSFVLSSDRVRTDASDGSLISQRYVYASGTIDSVTVTSLAAAVPEPATWVSMIAGFGLVGVAARRRRRAITA